MPEVSRPCSFACRAERLAGAGAGPDWLIVRPASAPQSVRPDADPGEEVALCVSKEFLRIDVFDAAFVHHARGDVAGGDQVPQPRCGIGVDLVVEGGHLATRPLSKRRAMGTPRLILRNTSE